MRRRIAILASVAAIACAADGGLRAPARGVVVAGDPATVRPVVGLPGASLLGDPLTAELRTPRVAPGGKYVAGEGAIVIASSGESRPVEGLRTAAALFTFSPSGTAAAFRDGDWLHIFAGLPGNPRPLTPVPLAPAGSVLSVAVSDDGFTVVAVTVDGEATVVSEAEAPRLVPGLGAVSAFGFLPGSRSGLAVDAKARLIHVDDVTSGISSVVAETNLVPGAPVQLAIALDGKAALLAQGRHLGHVNIAEGLVTASELRHKALRILAMGQSQFAISAEEEGGVWIAGDFAAPVYVPAAN